MFGHIANLKHPPARLIQNPILITICNFFVILLFNFHIINKFDLFLFCFRIHNSFDLINNWPSILIRKRIEYFVLEMRISGSESILKIEKSINIYIHNYMASEFIKTTKKTKITKSQEIVCTLNFNS